MPQRTNPDTGYPMSTDQQIDIAKEQISAVHQVIQSQKEQYSSFKAHTHTKEEDLEIRTNFVLDDIPQKADYYYKLGEYDKAEDAYLQIFYLNPDYANRLKIIYFRENRFKDALYILQFALKIFEQYNFLIYSPKNKEKIKKGIVQAKKRANTNSQKDKSIIDGESKIWIAQTSGEKLNKILSSEKEKKKVAPTKSNKSEQASVQSTKPKQLTKNKVKQKNAKTKKKHKKIGCFADVILLFVGAFLGQMLAGNVGLTIGSVIAFIICLFHI